MGDLIQMTQRPPELREVRASALAEIVGLSPQRVRELAAEGVVVRTRHGYYDLSASVKGLVLYWQAKAQERDQGDGHRDRLQELELREREARTLTAELAYHEKVGALFPTAAIVDRWNQVQTVAKQQLQAVPGKMRGRYALDPDVLEHLSELIDDALNELARSDPFPRVE